MQKIIRFRKLIFGTIAIYKCDKYFKPVNTQQKYGGTLSCIEDGTWDKFRNIPKRLL